MSDEITVGKVVFGNASSGDIRRRTYSPEQSADIAAKLAAKNAKIERLKAKVVEYSEVIDVDHHVELKLRVALRETREALEKLTALVATADTEGGQIIEPEWLPVLEYNDTIVAVLARHADLAGEAEHG